MMPHPAPAPSPPPPGGRQAPIARGADGPPRAVVERRWRLLLMIAEDDTIGRVQMDAEMGPLVEAVAPDRRRAVIVATLEWLRDHDLIERHGGCYGRWRATDRGQDVVRRRGGM